MTQTDSAATLSLLRFAAPRYWLTWLGMGLIFLSNQLPFRIQMKIGRAIGSLTYYLAPRRRRIAQVNIDLCFPGRSAQEKSALLKKHFQSLGIALLETGLSWWAPKSKLASLVKIEGLEHLQTTLAEGHSVILLSAHFTTLEIGGRLLSFYAPFHVMYREHKNPLFEDIMRRARQRHYEKAIPRSDIRGMMRSLKQKMPVWYAPDQNYGAEHSIFVPFFGVPAATITATSRLIKMSGAKVVPFFQQRLDDDSGYQIRIYPPLENVRGQDPAADTIAINHCIEQEILKMPEQYLWVHRRFKTRPEGESGVY